MWSEGNNTMFMLSGRHCGSQTAHGGCSPQMECNGEYIE